MNQGLQALQLASTLRGPRNAFQQQAVLHGLNGMGLSNAVGALRGETGVPLFEGDHASPQSASLQTMYEDMQAAGPGGQAGNPYDVQMQIARGGLQNPYGVGGQMALGAAAGLYANPNGQGADIQYGAAKNDLLNPYGSPSSDVAMQIAGKGVGEAGPAPDSARVRGGGAVAVNGWNALTANATKLGLPQPTGQDAVNLLMSAFGMSQAQALELNQHNRDWYTSGAGNVDPARMEVDANQILQRDHYSQLQTPQARAQQTTNDYYNVLRQTGAPYLSADDPRLLNIYQTDQNLRPDEALYQTRKSADTYRATGRPITPGQMAANVVAPQVASVGQGAQLGYDRLINKLGVPYLSATDPRLQNYYSSYYGTPPAGAAAAAKADSTYYTHTGFPSDPYAQAGRDRQAALPSFIAPRAPRAPDPNNAYSY
jgi:hypothetical protein